MTCRRCVSPHPCDACGWPPAVLEIMSDDGAEYLCRDCATRMIRNLPPAEDVAAELRTIHRSLARENHHYAKLLHAASLPDPETRKALAREILPDRFRITFCRTPGDQRSGTPVRGIIEDEGGAAVVVGDVVSAAIWSAVEFVGNKIDARHKEAQRLRRRYELCLHAAGMLEEAARGRTTAVASSEERS